MNTNEKVAVIVAGMMAIGMIAIALGLYYGATKVAEEVSRVRFVQAENATIYIEDASDSIIGTANGSLAIENCDGCGTFGDIHTGEL